MWLASPSANTNYSVMLAYYSGNMTSSSYTDGAEGFRPIVCLKSNIHLLDNGDNTYSIKEAITAKAEYNKDTNQIEVRVAYSDNPISKIMLNNTNELSMSNTSGIITANTVGMDLEDGTNVITITDTKGNKKELTVKVKIPLSIYYGKEVTNYTCSSSGVDKWRVFHVDDNIYLIADDYVPYANLPTSTSGTALNKGNTNYRAYFTAILNNYTGSAWIRTNTNEQARNWLTWVNSYPSSTNDNIKAVAYMMDTNKWSAFKGDKAEYAIGGPTLELFCASYKVTHPDRYIECNSMTSNGYQVKWSDGSYTTTISVPTLDEYNSIYIKSNTTKTYGMWLVSPSAVDRYRVMYARCNGLVDGAHYSYTDLGFRPVVCLKSGVKLIDNGDGTCSIQ